jgi:hypothetical protein
MPRNLGAVATDAHVTPATPPGWGAVDEYLTTSVIRAGPQPMRIVLGEEVGQRAGDGGTRLVEVIADLGDRIPTAFRIGHELVVVQAVAEDVVEVADLLPGWSVPIVHPFSYGVDEAAQVSEPLEAAFGLGGIPPETLRLLCPPALIEEAVLLEPREQGGRLRDVVRGNSAGVLEGIREDHEQLFGLGRFWQQVRALCHCTNHYKRLDKLQPDGYTSSVTDKNRDTSYEFEREARPMEMLVVVLLVVLVDLAAIRSGADSRPSFDDMPARSI